MTNMEDESMSLARKSNSHKLPYNNLHWPEATSDQFSGSGQSNLSRSPHQIDLSANRKFGYIELERD